MAKSIKKTPIRQGFTIGGGMGGFKNNTGEMSELQEKINAKNLPIHVKE